MQQQLAAQKHFKSKVDFLLSLRFSYGADPAAVAAAAAGALISSPQGARKNPSSSASSSSSLSSSSSSSSLAPSQGLPALLNPVVACALLERCQGSLARLLSASRYALQHDFK